MKNILKEPALRYNYITPEEYLETERSSEEKNEYYDGHIVTLSGASLTHNRISSNLSLAIGNFLKGKSCEIFTADMRVSTPLRDAYMYPDAVIVCEKPKLEDDKFDTLINPTVIIEILSPSTQGYDGGYKLMFYQQIPSLKEYVMIDSQKYYIQVVRKQPDGAWRFETLDDTADHVELQSIRLQLELSDIYENTDL